MGKIKLFFTTRTTTWNGEKVRIKRFISKQDQEIAAAIRKAFKERGL